MAVIKSIPFGISPRRQRFLTPSDFILGLMARQIVLELLVGSATTRLTSNGFNPLSAHSQDSSSLGQDRAPHTRPRRKTISYLYINKSFASYLTAVGSVLSDSLCKPLNGSFFLFPSLFILLFTCFVIYFATYYFDIYFYFVVSFDIVCFIIPFIFVKQPLQAFILKGCI